MRIHEILSRLGLGQDLHEGTLDVVYIGGSHGVRFGALALDREAGVLRAHVYGGGMPFCRSIVYAVMMNITEEARLCDINIC